ncbi:bacillithiol biosynthesis cysteine-adding enzyme BshC [Aquibacillus koreensis]|uniref:Putative cysteine ligase BshC n=1 Tax=Aquibacillus koreensis TaxID=279446 RepID=A0A9X3WLU5_9BACI|nr:bacillithiol biosynthesis cysteine-adding enzyme BshC [Aquibacillus koreensis]MCT2538068.1 bacillithiol biosynthesis cysteine-adding enzyme BshC [Aquibacillus koreensis]MDC3420591.1 bacillithiol biosynthesis cysteine-adding enzyme BshC [Aquibacillus koreensis]
MWIDPIKLHKKNKLLTDYYLSKPDIINKFDYLPYNADTYKQRVDDLNQRSFNRSELTRLLFQLNQKWNAPDSTFENIERLKDDSSVVVIGGQQAGLLTGPLYTIHKIVSIIHFAREKEKELNIPVIPVFWIAGEDHDFAEINHIMTGRHDGMRKLKINHQVNEKKSVSMLQLDKVVTSNWLKDVFKDLDETVHTNDLHELLQGILQNATTYVDFFASFIYHLFQKEGLVLIDSGDHLVRQAESSFFKVMIEKQPEISKGAYQMQHQVRNSGYSISVEVEEHDAHLFYHKDGERILLTRSVDGNWVGKHRECEFTTDQMIEIATQTPELLSNNVITRPLMQEMLFPSLAFLGGPGEVGYWSVLKPVFHAMGLKMPPVLPRISMTFVDHSIEKKVKKRSLEVESVINNGVDLEKGNWLRSQTYPSIDGIADQVADSIERAHRPLRELAKSLSPDLGQLAEKNLLYLMNDVRFLQDELLKSIKDKHEHTIRDFERIQLALNPDGGLQERCWNIVPYLNRYGFRVIQELLEQPYTMTEEHYVVYL